MLLRGPGVVTPSSGDPSGALGRVSCSPVSVSTKPSVARAMRSCWIVILCFHLSPPANDPLPEDPDIVPAFLGPRVTSDT